MALLQRFDPPAFLFDYDGIPGQREAWHAFISRCFESSIASEGGRVKRADNTPGTVQFYSSAAYDPGGPVIEQAIVWNAFPKELLRRYGRERALVEANKLWPLRRNREDLRPGSPPCSDFTAAKTSQRSANRLDFRSLGASQRVFNVDSEITQGALNLGMVEQNLDST